MSGLDMKIEVVSVYSIWTTILNAFTQGDGVSGDPLKGQIGNILGFEGHWVSVTIT